VTIGMRPSRRKNVGSLMQRHCFLLWTTFRGDSCLHGASLIQSVASHSQGAVMGAAYRLVQRLDEKSAMMGRVRASTSAANMLCNSGRGGPSGGALGPPLKFRPLRRWVARLHTMAD
jgi:hypothetical protein